MMKCLLFFLFFCTSAWPVVLKNSSSCFLTAYLQDSKTGEVFSVPVLSPDGGIAQIDLTGTEGPYTIEWLQLATPSSDQKSCWGAGTFDSSRTAIDSANFKGKGCCSASGVGKPANPPRCGAAGRATPCEKK